MAQPDVVRLPGSSRRRQSAVINLLMGRARKREIEEQTEVEEELFGSDC